MEDTGLSENEELKKRSFNGETADEDVKPCAPLEPAVPVTSTLKLSATICSLKKAMRQRAAVWC